MGCTRGGARAADKEAMCQDSATNRVPTAKMRMDKMDQFQSHGSRVDPA